MLALSGCTAGDETPQGGTREQKDAAAPSYFDVVTTSDGSMLMGNHGLQAFLAANVGETIDLNVLVYRGHESARTGIVNPGTGYGAAKGTTALTLPDDELGDTPYFTIVADSAVLPVETESQSGDAFVPLRGTVSVSETSGDLGAALELTLEKKPETPKTTDEKLCNADDTEQKLTESARSLASDITGYDPTRAQWHESPRLWWAVKSSAKTLIDSNGEAMGDAMSVACEEYWG